MAPVEEESNEAATTKDKKAKKDKNDKKRKKDKSKTPESDEPALAPPPAVTDAAASAEPLPANEAEDESKEHGDDKHDDRGKGHEKKK